MTQSQSNQKNKIGNIIIIIISIIGLIAFITLLFPQVRIVIMDLASQIVQKEASAYQTWIEVLFSYAIGGICFILFFDYCTLTKSGRTLVQNVKQEIKDCLSEIDFKALVKPVLLIFIVYFLGILTIIRANFLYLDDIGRSIAGNIGWHDWSRYISFFTSIFLHADANLTDISPLPQLFAIITLSISSTLLVYVIGGRKVTIIKLLASTPLGLSPFFLECLSYKFDAPYMALSVLASILPFLFIDRKKAFIFISVFCLLIMCMTYQASSGIYMLMTVIICFMHWNNKGKTNKEIISFLRLSVIMYCFSLLIFRVFLMKTSEIENFYASTAIYSLSNIVHGTLSNINNYALTINHDFGLIWKICILSVLSFFIIKSVYKSAQRKVLSFFVVFSVIVISFISSYGVYIILEKPLYEPRSMYGFGVFLAIICINIVTDYKKFATVTVLVLNWCFFVFAFSYGNALADQARYAEFRIGVLLHDLSALFSEQHNELIFIQFQNSIDYAPSIKNILKYYPIIERLVPKRLGVTNSYWDDYRYILDHFNYKKMELDCSPPIVNGNVVLDSYYHTIKSDGENFLVILKH